MMKMNKLARWQGPAALATLVFTASFGMGACFDSTSTLCPGGDGLRCPVRTTCTVAGDACLWPGEMCGNGIVDDGEGCDDGNRSNNDNCPADCSESTLCGNGALDPGEVCDDANNTDGDGCSANCASDERCGNGYKDLTEGCDDGNNDNGDGCSASCVSENCGNGQDDPGETCDDGNNESGDGCSADCLSTEICGNGFVDIAVGENCDDGNNEPDDGCDPVCRLESCGNNQMDPGEVCDDGNNESGDGCSADCLSTEFCGNGYIDVATGESCDDGNAVDNDGCSAGCQLESCGNGLIDPGEECDDGNNAPGDGCSGDCLSTEVCGNGYLDSVTEACDDGNTVPGDGCSAICEIELCGNGVVDPGEVCDDGNVLSGDGCSSDCGSNEMCGNGHRDVGETCDDGNQVSGDGCNEHCHLESCGNGMLEPGEVCDDGNNLSGDGCSANCLSDETCGNGYNDVEIGETCDDGNNLSGDGCSAACQLELCGNGIINPGEACDDGNSMAGDGCTPDCLSDETCGNNYRDFDEQCDDGNLAPDDGCDEECVVEYCGDGTVNNNGEACDGGGETAACNSDCTLAICGDGKVNPSAGEQCDDSGESATCDADCTAAYCGDGTANTTAGEACDGGGETAACDSDCSAVVCGDGTLNASAGEQCESGGMDSMFCDGGDCTFAECGDNYANSAAGETCDDGGDTASCDSDCSPVVCGDGYANAASGEACDDGGDSAACDADCSAVACGDGYTNLAAGEECDTAGESASCDLDCTDSYCGDGTLNASAGEACDPGGETAACDWDCSAQACGDGQVNALAGEECDDGNGAVGDGCSAACLLEYCGNGVVDGAFGEVCDDGNADNTDDCTDSCELADCQDGYANADETDVDCGGHCGARLCHLGQMCLSDSDCGSNNCAGGVCRSLNGQLVQGYHHTCLLRATGAVRCWGWNGYGQLGYGHTTDIGDDETPTSAGDVNVGGVVTQLAAGFYHTCALLDTGAVRCWGRNNSGQLGYGHTTDIGDDETPASAGDIVLGGTAVQLTAGDDHTCALLNTGAIRCWGYNSHGELGYGHTTGIGDNETPASAGDIVLGGTAVQLTAGEYHTCALLDTGAIRCWGDNAYGQLGYGNTTDIGDNETPASAGDVPVGGTAETIDAGRRHTCALLSTGAMRCWGYNGYGVLGYGHTNYIGDDETSASAGDIDTGGTVVQISAFRNHTCALLSTGVLRCWGFNSDGQLGQGNTSHLGDDEVPSSVSSISVVSSGGGDIAELAVGRGRQTCVRLTTGGLRCWGWNEDGQLGYGHTDDIGANPGEMPPADIEVDDPCPGDLQGLRGNNGQSLVCHCSAAATATGSVWGTDIYSDDSGVCRAAVHAGAITTAGGTVTAEILPGQASYTGSTQNGVTSTSLGSHPGSYQFLGL